MVNSGNCLFRVTKLTTIYDPNKYGYSGCGIESDVRSIFHGIVNEVKMLLFWGTIIVLLCMLIIEKTYLCFW